MKTLTAPAVHLNGTSRNALGAGYRDAAHAILRAIESLEDTAPNARDYYVQGEGAFTEALREHCERVKAMQGVLAEVRSLHEAVIS